LLFLGLYGLGIKPDTEVLEESWSTAKLNIARGGVNVAGGLVRRSPSQFAALERLAVEQFVVLHLAQPHVVHRERDAAVTVDAQIGLAFLSDFFILIGLFI